MIRTVVMCAGVLASACVAAADPETSPPALDSPLEAGWKGEQVCELLFENVAVRALRCTFPPGVGHERHFHAPHWGYALAGGTFRMTDAAGTREVATAEGAGFWNDGIAWHEVLNVGDTTAAYLIVEPKAAGGPP